MNAIDMLKQEVMTQEKITIECVGQASLLTRGYGDVDWERSTQNGYSS